MNLSPFYRVLVAGSGRDLSEHITSFVFEDCTDQDDLLKLVLGNVPTSLVDDHDLRNGTKLLFSWGYIGGASSKQRSAIIVGIEPSFNATLTIVVQASHAGVSTKKTNQRTLHQGQRSSDIARFIAKKHGLKADVQDTERVLKSIPSAGKTDYELLKYLASREEAGLFEFRIKDDTLVFKRRDLKKPSRRTFTWNDGSGVVLSFKPKDSDLHKKGQSAQTTVPGVNPFTGQPFTARAKDGQTRNDTKLGVGRSHYDQDGNFAFRDKPAPTIVVVTPAADAAGADDIANQEKKKAGMDDLTASLSTVGDPRLEADELITMAGVGTTFGGNWYMKKVTHTITPGAVYLNSIELSRNAVGKKASVGSPANEDRNTGAGPAKTDGGKDVRVHYDQDSFRVK